MKVVKKSPTKRLQAEPARATLTLSRETYRKIDALRAGQPRSAWVQNLIDREEARLERLRLVEEVRQQYTPALCRQMLAINEEYPIDEA